MPIVTTLGIDTSNYTTSAAAYMPSTGEGRQSRKLLPVKEGQLGLRQSDAVFHHMQQFPDVFSAIPSSWREIEQVSAIGVSIRPRDVEGSYMPCFLAGHGFAKVLGEAYQKPVYCFSHQAGHLMAALYSSRQMGLYGRTFLAFHLSGGTTEALLVHPSSSNPFVTSRVACSLDLKAGQVIDRVGVMLGCSFPAGKELAALAEQSDRVFSIRPSMKGCDCSFSGLENQAQALWKSGCSKEDVAKFILDSIEKALSIMTERLLQEYGSLPLVYAGGVMSNRQIRERMLERFPCFFAQPELSSDNAMGIAVLAAFAHEETCLPMK